MNLINVKVKQVCAKDFINETNKNKISNEFLKNVENLHYFSRKEKII